MVRLQPEPEDLQALATLKNRLSGRPALMPGIALACAAAMTVLLPSSALSQDTAYTQGRLDRLQRQIADLSSKLEQLKVQDQQLQQRLEAMRAKFEARLERLEKGNAPVKGKPR